MSLEPKRAFKVVLVGNPAVGKTSIRRKYMGRSFRTDYLRTIGADFASRKVTINDELILLTIWDLAGQSIFEGMRTSFYQGSKSSLVVIDVTDEQSLEDANKWAKESVAFARGVLCNIYLIANKIDLTEKRVVTQDAVMAKARELESETGLPVTVVETSALTGENITRLFDDLCEFLLKIETADSQADIERVRFLGADEGSRKEISLADRVVALERKVIELEHEVDRLKRVCESK